MDMDVPAFPIKLPQTTKCGGLGQSFQKLSKVILGDDAVI